MNEFSGTSSLAIDVTALRRLSRTSRCSGIASRNDPLTFQ